MEIRATEVRETDITGIIRTRETMETEIIIHTINRKKYIQRKRLDVKNQKSEIYLFLALKNQESEFMDQHRSY
jgi:hypothetical protein